MINIKETNWSKSTYSKINTINEVFSSQVAWWWPPGSLGRCKPIHQVLQYTFQEQELADALKLEKHDIVVQNGTTNIDHPEYIKATTFRENIVFCKNSQQNCGEVSALKMKGVLMGEVKNWKELGGDDLPINIYRFHSNSKDVAKVVFSKHSLGLSGIDINNFKKSSSYRKLHNIARNDKSALLIGLRGVKLEGVNILKIKLQDGDYPFSYPVNIYIKKKIKNHAVIKKFLILLSQRQKTDLRNLLNIKRV